MGCKMGCAGMQLEQGGLHGLSYPGALQDLLLAPSTAQLLDGFLNGTSWKLPELATFLIGPVDGPGLTWHQVYADVDAVLRTLSQFMEVCVTPVWVGWPLAPPMPTEPYLPSHSVSAWTRSRQWPLRSSW